jgi:LysR family glycine cleavage system transcriptional activator
VLNPAGEALLRSVQAALSQLEDGVQAAAAAASGNAQRIRMTVLPSFAQRWLLPRMGRWRERHPDLALEIDASPQLVDLQREGFHVGVRVGRGPWQGCDSERLFDSPIPFVVVGSPAAARRLLGAQPEMLAREPLLDEPELWERWFAAAGLRTKVTTVALFNDAGLLLQAAEQNLGLALCRELLAADALHDGRLVKLSPVSDHLRARASLSSRLSARPARLGAVVALRRWLRDELELSQKGAWGPPAVEAAPQKCEALTLRRRRSHAAQRLELPLAR